MSETISDGGMLEKDPDASLVYSTNWDARWPAGVDLASSAWSIVGPDSALTYDNPGFDAGLRTTSARLLGGTLGKTYTVTNRVVTAETPSQTDDSSFFVRIVEK